MPLRSLLVALLALSLSACVFRISERNFIVPRPGALVEAGPPDHGRWTTTPLAVTASDGFILHGAVFRKAGSTGRVLYFAGNGFVLSSDADYVLRIYRDLPLDVIIFDHRGYGANAGPTSLHALFDDGVAIFDAVSKQVPGPGPLLVHGQSLGSFIAGEVAARRTLDGLILESSATTTREWIKTVAGIRRFLVRVHIDDTLKGQGNLRIMAGLDEPLLIVVGQKDKQTHPIMSRELFAAAALPPAQKELLIVPGATHMTASSSPAFTAAVLRLVAKARTRTP